MPVVLLGEPMTAGYPANVRVRITVTPGLMLRFPLSGTCPVLPLGFQLGSWPGYVDGDIEWFTNPQTSPGSGSGPLLEDHTFTATFTPQQSGLAYFTAHGTSMPDNALVDYPDWVDAVVVSVPFTILRPQRLGYWKFETPQWVGEEGQAPNATVNLSHVQDWNRGALSIAGSAKLGYNAFQGDGMPNVTRNRGTVRFWFKPNWSSGTGPGVPNGQYAYLFQMDRSGQPDSDWMLKVNWTGQAVTLQAPGVSLDASPLNLVAGQWYQIAATYSDSANDVAVYLNGIKITSTAASGVTWMPDALSGFTVGSARDGTHTANGLFDELETFNYVLDEPQIATDYLAARNLDSDGDTIPNMDELPGGTDPWNPDTDGDGVWDNLDPFPTDPNRWDPVNPGDTTPPGITLLQPISAVENP